MPNTPIAVVRSQRRLDALFERVSQIGDMEMQAHWARYLCVLCAGHLEVSVRAIMTECAKTRSAPEIANYVESRLALFRNPKMQVILDVVGAFRRTWADDLEASCEGDRKDAVDSILANRHQIAHGEDTGITFVRVREYYGRACEVLNELALLVLDD